jgi:hypothetical protein
MSDRPRKGEHRFHIAFANSADIAHCTYVMAKADVIAPPKKDLVSGLRMRDCRKGRLRGTKTRPRRRR